MDDAILQKAEVLVEAMPYIQKYRGSYFVIKVGGSIFRIPEAKTMLLTDIAFLNLIGVKCILVCGGGPFITEEIEKRGKKAVFIDGLRVTDDETLAIVREVLCGVRDELVCFLKTGAHVRASGLEPEENYLFAQKIHYQRGADVIDLGHVGRVEDVNVPLLEERTAAGEILVFAPLAYSRDGQLYNVNGDLVASSVAEALHADKLMFVTNVWGVMRNPQNPETLISVLTTAQAEKLIGEGVVKSGMVPKVKAAVSAIKKGVKKVHIINGSIAHSILLEVFTDQGVGTEIV